MLVYPGTVAYVCVEIAQQGVRVCVCMGCCFINGVEVDAVRLSYKFIKGRWKTWLVQGSGFSFHVQHFLQQKKLSV